MTIETVAIESQENPSTIEPQISASQQSSEIVPLAPECLNLVGGGSGIVVFG